MTFSRAAIVAAMTTMMVSAYPDPLGLMAAVLVGYALWAFTSDPPSPERPVDKAFADYLRRIGR